MIKADKNIPDGVYGEGDGGFIPCIIMAVRLKVNKGNCVLLASKRYNYTLHSQMRQNGEKEFFIDAQEIPFIDPEKVLKACRARYDVWDDYTEEYRNELQYEMANTLKYLAEAGMLK